METVVQRLLSSSNGEHPPLSNFINGHFEETKKHMDSVDPSTGKSWIKIPDSEAADVEKAVAAAENAFPRYCTEISRLKKELQLVLDHSSASFKASNEGGRNR